MGLFKNLDDHFDQVYETRSGLIEGALVSNADFKCTLLSYLNNLRDLNTVLREGKQPESWQLKTWRE